MPDDLEKLFAEAALAPAAPDVVDHPTEYAVEKLVEDLKTHPMSSDMDCKHCGHACRYICPTCGGAFCEDHASPLDKTYCSLCLPEPMLELKELPLKDADGVTHAGRILIPKEPSYNKLRFGTLAKSISEMSSFELDSHIDNYKHLVKQAETLLDSRRITLGSMLLERDQREDAQRRALRADKRKYPIKTVDVGKPGSKPSLAGLVKMMDMLKALDAQQKAKHAAKAAQQAVVPEVK